MKFRIFIFFELSMKLEKNKSIALLLTFMKPTLEVCSHCYDTEDRNCFLSKTSESFEANVFFLQHDVGRNVPVDLY